MEIILGNSHMGNTYVICVIINEILPPNCDYRANESGFS